MKKATRVNSHPSYIKPGSVNKISRHDATLRGSAPEHYQELLTNASTLSTTTWYDRGSSSQLKLLHWLRALKSPTSMNTWSQSSLTKISKQGREYLIDPSICMFQNPLTETTNLRSTQGDEGQTRESLRPASLEAEPLEQLAEWQDRSSGEHSTHADLLAKSTRTSSAESIKHGTSINRRQRQRDARAA
jgi:hypothetical protein